MVVNLLKLTLSINFIKYPALDIFRQVYRFQAYIIIFFSNNLSVILYYSYLERNVFS